MITWTKTSITHAISKEPRRTSAAWATPSTTAIDIPPKMRASSQVIPKVSTNHTAYNTKLPASQDSSC